jgi:hypothetical protein
MRALPLAILAVLMPLSVSAQEQPLRPNAQGQVVIPQYDGEAIGRWAACAWNNLPISADNLLQYTSNEKVPPDNGPIPFTSAEELLNVRLNKVCGELLPRDQRSSIRPGIKIAKINILKSSRPQNVATDDAPVSAYLCAHKLGERYVLTELILETPSPQRALPGATADCFVINSDGSLTDA